MKKILLILALLAPVSGFAQGLKASDALKINLLKFAHEDGSAVVQMEMDVNSGRVGTKERWEITPVLEADSAHSMELPPIVVSGRSRAKMYKRALKLGHSPVVYGAPDPLVDEVTRRGAARPVVYNATVPWQPWMADASLYLRSRHITCSNEVYPAAETLAGVLAGVVTPEVTGAPKASYVAPVRGAEKMHAIVKTAYIDFHVNQSAVIPSLNHNARELDAIAASIDEVRKHPDYTFNGIELTGYASPEGPYANNDRLASARVDAVMNYLASHYNIDRAVMSRNHVAEDWAGLRKEIEQSGLPNKEAALKIIDSGLGNDDREAALKALGSDTWHTIMQMMMPQLRRTEYRVNYSVRDYNVADSRKTLLTNPEHLSHYELDALARTLDPASKEYQDIYNLIEVQNPNDDIANINVAANYISHQDWTGAAAALARVKNPDAAYWNNFGIVQMMTGNPSAAANAFRQAGTADAQYNTKLLGQ
jgi:outer membrane protein OmpA-like peptidoglycan-associated protein